MVSPIPLHHPVTCDNVQSYIRLNWDKWSLPIFFLGVTIYVNKPYLHHIIAILLLLFVLYLYPLKFTLTEACTAFMWVFDFHQTPTIFASIHHAFASV